jgi:hypothetical protein
MVSPDAMGRVRPLSTFQAPIVKAKAPAQAASKWPVQAILIGLAK